MIWIFYPGTYIPLKMYTYMKQNLHKSNQVTKLKFLLKKIKSQYMLNSIPPLYILICKILPWNRTWCCIYVMDAMWGDKVPTWQQYAPNDVDLLQQRECTQVPTEGRAVLWRPYRKKVKWCSQDVSEVCKGVDVSWMLTAITTTQSITFEGSRLQECGYVSASIQACMSTWSEQSNV